MTIALQAIDDRRTGPGGDGSARRAGGRGAGGSRPALRYEVAGVLDADAAHEVRDVERPAVPNSVVEIDLHRCEGVDDFGFGSLVGLIRRAREHDARVRLRGADAELRDELERSGVARLVDVVSENEVAGDASTGSGR